MCHMVVIFAAMCHMIIIIISDLDLLLTETLYHYDMDNGGNMYRRRKSMTPVPGNHIGSVIKLMFSPQVHPTLFATNLVVKRYSILVPD